MGAGADRSTAGRWEGQDHVWEARGRWGSQRERRATRWLQTDQKQEKGVKALCVPANLREGPAALLPFFLRRKTSSCWEGGGRARRPIPQATSTEWCDVGPWEGPAFPHLSGAWSPTTRARP